MKILGQDAETWIEFNWLAWGLETSCSHENDSNPFPFAFIAAGKSLENNP